MSENRWEDYYSEDKFAKKKRENSSKNKKAKPEKDQSKLPSKSVRMVKKMLKDVMKMVVGEAARVTRYKK